MLLNQYAIQLAKEVEHSEEISMEAFDTFLEFLTQSMTSVSNIIRKVINEDFRAIDSVPLHPLVIQGTLTKFQLDFDDLQKVMVYRPEKLTRPMVDFSQTMLEQFTLMTSIDERLYEPAIRWFAQAASREGFDEKAWVDRKLTMVSLDDLREEMAKHYVQPKRETGHSDMIEFSRLYGSEKQYMRSYDNLFKLAEIGKDYDLKKLKALEAKLSEYVRTYIDNGYDGMGGEIPKATRTRIADTLRHIATETEYLAALTFILTTTITAWNDTITKLEVEIEEMGSTIKPKEDTEK